MFEQREDPRYRVLADKDGRAFLGEEGIHFNLPVVAHANAPLPAQVVVPVKKAKKAKV